MKKYLLVLVIGLFFLSACTDGNNNNGVYEGGTDWYVMKSPISGKCYEAIKFDTGYGPGYSLGEVVLCSTR